MAGDLRRGVGALTTFQKTVNTLLTEFEGGAGGNRQVAMERVTRSSLGHAESINFAEANDFFDQYNRVHTALVRLSKSLGDQIEMLRIAVHAADVGYDNVDEEKRRRFHEIKARLSKEYDAAERAKEQEQAKTKAPGPKLQDGTSGTTGLE
ncbi:hypothetical protein [Streptomyces ficellus]|uniref:Uncharacterized protein n=1 Tax=Streptomyces ficellus TaxID=1977088 RepID=A0A6I6F2J7_9ACTN|nr:hypothetical protein [Streptomyces ficellus]QGV78183.1 hypothetical protein EIZ62_07940 [Streptomyces ficellus]